MDAVIPQSIETAVNAALREAGDFGPFRSVEPASKGGVSDTLRLKTDKGDYFLKWNATPWCGTFTTEDFQLKLLRQTQTARVPVVVGFAEGTDGNPAWMLQEWAGGAEPGDEEQRLGARLGERIAALHQATSGKAPGYGYVERADDGSPRWPTAGDWIAFTIDEWMHNINRARNENRWTAERNARVDRLIARLPDFLGNVKRTPTMLHGDLHGCNVRLADDGEPVIADPWLYFGDREKEIVSTIVSKDFPPAFYDAYNAVYPLETGFAERADLYKLSWYLSGLYYSDDPASGQCNAIVDPILARFVG